MRLYIADDNEDFAQIVRRVAERAGWDVTVCANGRELATEVATETGPAFLVVDIDMPELDGIEVIEELKDIKRRMRVRFITGGHDSAALAARMVAEARGMDVGSFIMKPLPVDDLKAILQREADLLFPGRDTSA